MLGLRYHYTILKKSNNTVYRSMLAIMILDGALKNRDQLDIVEPSKHLPVQSQR